MAWRLKAQKAGEAVKSAFVIKGPSGRIADVKRMAAKLGRWSNVQRVEIARELRFAFASPVKVRRQGDHCVAIRTQLPGEAPSVLLLPLVGQHILRVECASGQAANDDDMDGGLYRVMAHAEGPEGTRQWLIAGFSDPRDAQACTELVARALGGHGGQGKRVASVAAAGLVIVLGFTMLQPAAMREGEAQARSAPVSPQAQVSALMQDAFGTHDAASADIAAAPVSDGGVLGSTGDSLADQIYADSMAAAQQSQYTMGPPAGPSRDITAGDFGLGVSSKEGCDPALKFKVTAP